MTNDLFLHYPHKKPQETDHFSSSEDTLSGREEDLSYSKGSAK